MTKTIWVLPVDTSLSWPQFPYVKALNQKASEVSSAICEPASSWGDGQPHRPEIPLLLVPQPLQF